MTWLVVGLLSLVVLAVAAFPFFRRPKTAPAASDPIRELRAQRQAVYRDVQGMYNDWVVGQVTEADYQRRLQEYRMQAALLLQEEQRLLDVAHRLEQEVLERRGKRGAKAARCANCSRPLATGVTRCPACGAQVAEASVG